VFLGKVRALRGAGPQRLRKRGNIVYFAGKKVLITGSARGIGRATAEALGVLGAQVVVVDRDEHGALATAEVIRSRGGQALACRCDLGVDDDVAGLAHQVGAIDLLINNAFARQVAAGSIDALDLEAWKRAFDINVLGNVRMLREFLPGMLDQGRGHIVDTASSLSIVPNADAQRLLPYIASKGAILGLAYGLRYALHSRGIAYSVFCPGLTATRQAQEEAVAARPEGAMSPSFAATILLEGIQRGDFLISSERDFESAIVRLAQGRLDPMALAAT
jgi:2-hydroxycyclohexanecarboxyl-CoA dehydrogenase